MIIRTFVLAAALCMAADVSLAQSAEDARDQRVEVVIGRDPGLEQRMALARELLDISVGPNFAKEFERAIADQLGKASSESGEERAWVRANMPPMLSRMVTRLIDEMVPSYARIYTEDELRGQIAFYRSPVGQAVAAKSVPLGVALEQTQTRVAMDFMNELQTKYCAQFDCGTGSGQAAAKPSRY